MPQIPTQNNPMQIIEQFNRFRQEFQGDPKSQVQELLNSGKMTQEQYNQISRQAQGFQSMLSMFGFKM